MTDWTCELTPRKAQQEILDLVLGEKRDEAKLYVVSPPGSGKTITALMVAMHMQVPTLVLVPNTAIQSQWVAKARFFKSGEDGPLASTDPDDRCMITVLTYQMLARTRDMTPEERESVLQEWQAELLEEMGDEESAAAWLSEYEERNTERFSSSLLRRWKTKRLAGEGGGEVVSPESLRLMEFLRAHGVGLVVFDECHHLLGYWAQVGLKLVETLGTPRVLGLTATPPPASDLSDREIELHRELLHEVDFSLPTPAVVKDGHLAPYQDLAYLTRPTERELIYVRNCSTTLGDVLEDVETCEGTTLSAWLTSQIDAIGGDKLATTLRRRSAFFSAAIRYLKERGLEVPGRLASFATGALTLDEKADLVGRYAVRCLLVSGNARDREFHERLGRAFRPLGFQLTEKGLRRCQSTVSRLLALSDAKMTALLRVLRCELSGDADVRALVITDFERSSSTATKRLSELLTDESGGATAAMRALTSDDTTDELDPILVTGQTVLVDDDLLPRFMTAATEWFEQHELKVQLLEVAESGFYRIEGKGPGWTTRHYVTMITDLFERGITRCLVGTRGLLGEGWDSLRANTLIDLTTAATEVTVNQLRGRAIRLDPENPCKVANIWDVVCIAPEFERGLTDYRRFARKHAGYYGLCDDGTIEFGLGHIHPALTEAGPEDVALNAHVINAEMEARALNRERVYADWRVGEPYANRRVSSLELKTKRSFVGRSVLQRQDKWRGYELSGNEQLSNICMAVLKCLGRLGLLKDARAGIEVRSRADGYFRVFLDTSSNEDMELFARSISELFAPVDKQRYVIPRYEEILHDTWISKLMPSVVKIYFQRKERRVAVYHPLPSRFGDSRKHADEFSDAWNEFVSPGRAVFAHRGQGERIVKEARIRDQTVEDARKKIKSIWR